MRDALLIRWSFFLAACALALGVALFAKAPAPARAATPNQRRAAAAELIANEHALRMEAAKDYPTDPWSQDDSFHSKERNKAREYAGGHAMPLTDVLGGLDDELRARAARGDHSISGSVPPCHPRAIY
jgi:hypothetical protein